MQTSENISVDLVLVVQSLIVLFLAAPPLVRAIFRLPAQEAEVSIVTDLPTAESGGLAPDGAVTHSRGSGARKLPIVLGVLTLLLAGILLRSSPSGDTTFQLSTVTDFVTLPDIVVPVRPTAWLMVVICLGLTAEAVRRMLTRVEPADVDPRSASRSSG